MAHFIFELLSAAGAIAIAYIGLVVKEKLGKIRESQLELRAHLIAHQVEIKEDLTAANARTSKDLEVHTARDEEQFRTVNGTLDRIERKIDNGHR